MIWQICFALSIVALVLTAVASVVFRRNNSGKKSTSVIVFGIAVSAVIIVFPANYAQINDSYLRTLLLSVLNAFRMFVLDDDFSLMLEKTSVIEGAFRTCYNWLAALIYIAAPVTTFGVVLSFFRKYAAYRTYLFHFFSPVYIFSELNSKSKVLALDLKKHEPQALIVFMNVGDDERASERAGYRKSGSKEIKCLLFKDSITKIKFSRHYSKSPITFFVMSKENDDLNISDTSELIEQYRGRENTRLYFFNDTVSGKLLAENADCGKMIVQRVNEPQRAVSSLLYDRGTEIFDSAVEMSDTDQKKITAVIVGTDKFAEEMFRALPWMCQMTGYMLEIHVFSPDEQTTEHLNAICPELLDEAHNGYFADDEEANYKIEIHPGIMPECAEFEKIFSNLGSVSFAFVSRGSDEENVSDAVAVRMLSERYGYHPCIWAVANEEVDAEKVAKGKLCNHRKQKYEISFVGDAEASYSRDAVLFSALEKAALARHMKWGAEEEFWRIEYCYRSSIASAIHKKYKLYCGVPGAEKEPCDRSEEEKRLLRKLEHKRWNAYMRSEGYVYSEVRNDLAKTHNCLKPFSELPEKEQIKDDD